MSVDVMALHRRYQSLRDQRARWITAWEELATFFQPTRYRMDWDTDSAKKPVLNTGLMSTAGVLAVRTLAAGMQGGMTSPARPWFKLALQGGEEAQTDSVGAWLDAVAERMNAALHRSNFYNAVHTLYADLGTFGTGCMIETADEEGLHFQVLRAGEYVVDIGADNAPDTLFHRSYMTAKQIMEEFGEDKAPELVRQCCKSSNSSDMDHRFNVIQAIYPRRDMKEGQGRSNENMPYASVYYIEEGEGGGKPSLLRESGFETFPCFIPRWDVSGTDVYGHSPAMDVLPDCKMLQQIRKTIIKSMHKLTDPPMAVDASLKKVGINLTPAAVNYFDFMGRGGSVGATPIIQTQPDAITIGQQAEIETTKIINEGLYVDLFKMLISIEDKRMTATEVDAREQEKMVLLGPVVERLQAELFRPVVERTFELLNQWDYLPEAPEELQGAPLKVEFVSILAMAQKMTSTSSLDQLGTFIGGMAGLVPEVVDAVDGDAFIDKYAEAVGATKGVLRGLDERQAVRQQRAQQQQQMMQQQQAATGVQNLDGITKAAKDLGETSLGADGKSALDVLTGGLGAL